jgi:hypothetical protein
MARACDKFISGRVETQTRENKIECLVAPGLAIAGVLSKAVWRCASHRTPKCRLYQFWRSLARFAG